jgi:hypothetical protein
VSEALSRRVGDAHRENFGEEPRYVVISRNGVLEATHALGVKPGIFGSASMSCASTLRAERTGCKHGPTTCGAVVSVR